MTATDKLRRMLDERGVKYDTAATVNSEIVATFWYDRDGESCSALEGEDDIPGGELSVQVLLTPAQVVDATLGRGTCEDVSGGDSCAFVCSECDAVYDHPADEPILYCPNCGRRVEP